MHAALQWLLRIVISSLAIILDPLTYLYSLTNNKKCPPPTNPILFKSATKLAAMIRNKEISSEVVVTAYIERCKEVNAYLNAIVEPRYDVAIREAQSIDKMIRSNERSAEMLEREFPLLGVPMTVKESLGVEGMSNNVGYVYSYRNRATKDAEIVRLARAAGAIPIAVTNTPQFCMNWETFNNVTGVTRNPYNLKCTPGGSSGGESALIAAAASVIGLGSDLAGSLRLPAMFTGIFGHKPTPRLLSIEGHWPYGLNHDFEDYFAVGPITRYAEDLPLLLKVLKRPNGPEVPFDKPVDITRLKFYYMESDGSYALNKIGPDVRKAMDKAKAYIKSAFNLNVRKLQIKNMHHMCEISGRIIVRLNHVPNIYTDPKGRSISKSMWPELLKKMVGMSNDSLFSVTYRPAQQLLDILPEGYFEELLKTLEQIKEDIKKELSDDAVLLFPTYPEPAHLHYRVFYKVIDSGYLSIFNVLGLPSTNCPISLTDKGLPVGIQIVANKYQDHLTLAVAKQFERAFGGWVPPK